MFNHCIRGATTVESNTENEILKNTEELLQEIIKVNNIKPNDVLSVIFTATRDLDAVYPAVAARQMGLNNAGLMCMQEMYVKGSLEKCIRVMLFTLSEKQITDIKHIYLKKAICLRPDISCKGFSVAIDGPAGSGKSTVAKLIAKKLNFIYVDTGAMYRAVGLYCIKNNIDCNDTDAVANRLNDINITVKIDKTDQRIILNGSDVTALLRTSAVASAAGAVAVINKVRLKLVEIQQEIAANQNIVMDGRDIGTNVLPNAQVKFYLDANIDIRAERRLNELKEKGIAAEYNTIKNDIEKRDEKDKNRIFSPLKTADDAIVIDTSNMAIEDVFNRLIEIIMNKMHE